MQAIPIVMAVSSLTGAGMSAYQQYASGQEQKNLYEYNAALQKQQAKAEEDAGLYEARRMRKEGEDLLGEQRAEYGKAGIDPTAGGSPLEVMERTASEIEEDILLGTRERKIKAAQLRSSASMQKQMGKSAASGGMWGAGGTLFKGAVDSYKTWKGLS